MDYPTLTKLVATNDALKDVASGNCLQYVISKEKGDTIEECAKKISKWKPTNDLLHLKAMHRDIMCRVTKAEATNKNVNCHLIVRQFFPLVNRKRRSQRQDLS